MRITILILIFAVMMFNILYSQSTRIDSVYAVPELDGSIIAYPDGEVGNVNRHSYAITVGDLGPPMVPAMPTNSYTRGYYSFLLPSLQNVVIDSVLIRLCQIYSIQNGSESSGDGFPEWNVPDGDTIKCIMSHINYGFELDLLDWTIGDENDPNTYDDNIGTISESYEDGYRFLNVSDCIEQDISNDRLMSQFRISFEIGTDFDDLSDYLTFVSDNTDNEPYRPKLYFHLTEIVSTSDTEISSRLLNIDSYPNPFNPQTTISYTLAESDDVRIQIYNLKGQLVETLVDEYKPTGLHSVLWNAEEQASGIYFYKIITGTEAKTGKCLLLK